MVTTAVYEPATAAVTISSLIGEACEWVASVFPQRSTKTETVDGFIASFQTCLDPAARKDCAKKMCGRGVGICG